MAKAKADRPVNKSQAIRDMITGHPEAKAGEIVALLAAQGVRVKPHMVYIVRSRAKNARRKQRRQKAVEASKAVGVTDSVKLILRIKELAEGAGGIKALKKLVDALAE
jgi:hypothetical protein